MRFWSGWVYPVDNIDKSVMFPVLILWSAASRFIGQRQAASLVKGFLLFSKTIIPILKKVIFLY